MHKILIISLFLTVHLIVTGQNLDRVRKTIDTLTSASMHGRGAVQGGDSLAAAYLVSKYQQLGLSQIAEREFKQNFDYPINTFPGKVSLGLGRKTLVLGRDYILAADACSLEGKLLTLFVDSSILSDEKKLTSLMKKSVDGKCLVIHEAQYRKFGLQKSLETWFDAFPMLILLHSTKLTGNLSPRQVPQCAIWMKKDAWELHKAKLVSVNVEAKQIPNHLSQNIIGTIRGSVYPDSFLIVSAHYDHLGMMGKEVYFPGANDNASGVSMLLEMADYFTKPENQLPFSIVFIAFGGEESGLIGSKYFAEHPWVRLKKVKFVLNLDLVGTGDAGITVVNGSVFEKQFNKLDSLNKEKSYFSVVKKRGKAANSDHYPFSEKGVPAFFVYTMGGIQAYHDVDDIAATLPLTKYKELFELLTGFLKGF